MILYRLLAGKIQLVTKEYSALASVFPSSSPYLLAEGVDHMHPVILTGVIAENGLGEAPRHVDEVVEGHGSDAASGYGDVGPQEPRIQLGVVALDLGSRTAN